MPFPIEFDKERARYFVRCLSGGTPIEIRSTAPGWPERNDMMVLAGVCFYLSLGRGPMTAPGVKLAEVHPERREAGEETLYKDQRLAVECYSNLVQHMFDGDYDRHYEDHVSATVYTDADGSMRFEPHSGFKGEPTL